MGSSFLKLSIFEKREEKDKASYKREFKQDFPLLPGSLIKNIIMYLPTREIVKNCLTLNKELHRLLNPRTEIKRYKISRKVLVFYEEIPLKDYISIIKKNNSLVMVKIIIKTEKKSKLLSFVPFILPTINTEIVSKDGEVTKINLLTSDQDYKKIIINGKSKDPLSYFMYKQFKNPDNTLRIISQNYLSGEVQILFYNYYFEH